MSTSRRVLFVSHDAGRSGGTLFLLEMLRWMRQHTDLQFDVALRWGGEMRPAFEALAPCVLLHPMSIPGLGRCAQVQGWWDRHVRHRRSYRTLQSLVDSGSYDLLYLNTITLGDHLASLRRLPVPVITHVHELASAIRRHAHGQERLVVRSSEQVICVSDAVLENLVSGLACPRAKARRIHGFVPVDAEPSATREELRTRLLAPLGIPPDAWLIGMCGFGNVGKGIDLAAPLARLLPAKLGTREVHMVWVGAEGADYPRERAVADATHAGVGPRLHFAGETRAPVDWLSILDVHLMLSREDSFPLVMMEAAVQGVPTVAFSDTGGAMEFLGEDAGVCTPFLDLPGLAATLERLLGNDAHRHALGTAARSRVRRSHAPDVIVPQLMQVIEEVRGGRSTSGLRQGMS